MATHFEMSDVAEVIGTVTIRGDGYLHFEDQHGNTVALKIGNRQVTRRMAQVWQDAKDAGEV